MDLEVNATTWKENKTKQTQPTPKLYLSIYTSAQQAWVFNKVNLRLAKGQ